MREPDYHKDFKKNYAKLPPKTRDKFKERLRLFNENPHAPELNNHGLHGKYAGCRSINVTGDLRAIYEIREERIHFLDINTHSNLY
jgi:addiction module RelE/StbE family toxin